VQYSKVTGHLRVAKPGSPEVALDH
jgi:hypothetical protein